MRPLIEEGHVYIARSPLYIVKRGGRIISFLINDEAKEKWELQLASKMFPKKNSFDEKDIAAATKLYSLNYIKGLGELNSEDLCETTMSKSNRSLLQVTISNVEEIQESFRVLMDSSAVNDRKEFISTNALEAVNVDM